MASGGETEGIDRAWTLVPGFTEHAYPTDPPTKAASRRWCIASEQLAREWDELAVRAGATPYLRPGWIEAWWLAFGKGELQIKTLRRNGRLVALLPLADYRGVLRSASNYHSPRAGLLAEDLASAIELARSIYAENPERLSITSLDPAGNSIKACCLAADAAGYKVVARPYQCSPYLDIKGDWQTYQSGLSGNLLSNLRKARLRLVREGRLTIEVISEPESLGDLLKDAFAVEASGWKGMRGTAIQSSPTTSDFYTNVARWAAGLGMLRLFFLRLEGRPLAMYYALEDRGTCYLLKGGYDSACRRYSPGKLLLHAVVSYCFTAHLSKIEFHGDAEPYKFLWADSVHEQKRFEAFQPTTTGKLRWAAIAYMKPAVKRMLKRFDLRTRFRD